MSYTYNSSKLTPITLIVCCSSWLIIAALNFVTSVLANNGAIGAYLLYALIGVGLAVFGMFIIMFYYHFAKVGLLHRVRNYGESEPHDWMLICAKFTGWLLFFGSFLPLIIVAR